MVLSCRHGLELSKQFGAQTSSGWSTRNPPGAPSGNPPGESLTRQRPNVRTARVINCREIREPHFSWRLDFPVMPSLVAGLVRLIVQ